MTGMVHFRPEPFLGQRVWHRLMTYDNWEELDAGHPVARHVGPDAFDVAVAPLLVGVDRSVAAAFFDRPDVGPAIGSRFDRVGLAVDDVDPA